MPGQKHNKISSKNTAEWEENLTPGEAISIEYLLKDYMDFAGYPTKVHNRVEVLNNLRLSMFHKPDVKFKDFLVPYVRILRSLYFNMGSIVKLFFIKKKQMTINSQKTSIL